MKRGSVPGSSIPDYIIADVEDLDASDATTPLRQKALPVQFPLTNDDKRDIHILEHRLENEIRVLSLAANQLGILKRIIAFEIPKKIFPGVKPFPKSIWINPTYKKVDDKVERRTEECHSVKNRLALVERYKRVRYEAYNVKGQLVTGIATGFAARVIQHETDHLDGKLFIDLVPKKQVYTYKEYLRKFDMLGENDDVESLVKSNEWPRNYDRINGDSQDS